MNKNYPKTSIIILNWDGWEDTIECLESLFRINYPNYEVILVDNGSKDNSINKIKKWIDGKIIVNSNFFDKTKCTHNLKLYEYTKTELDNGNYLLGKKNLDKLDSNKKLFLLKNDKNYGFAEGNNIAMRQVMNEGKSHYLLLLNNDTVVEKNFLHKMIQLFKQDNNIGIISSKNFYYSKPNKIWFAGGVLQWRIATTKHIGNNKKNNIKYNKNYETEYGVGSSFCIDNKVIKNIGYLDKNYFAYGEDADYCLRAKKQKYKIYHCGKSIIYHKVSSSSKKNSDYTSYLQIRNKILLHKKNFNKVIFFVFMLALLLFKIPLWILIKKIKIKTSIKAIKDGFAFNV